MHAFGSVLSLGTWHWRSALNGSAVSRCSRASPGAHGCVLRHAVSRDMLAAIAAVSATDE